MRSRNDLLYLVADAEFYESIDYYRPNVEDFLKPVRQILRDDWTIVRSGVWFHCSSPNSNLPLQGWKIHVSSGVSGANEIVHAVVPILCETQTDFKFAVDVSMLTSLNSKNWGRSGSGKFITIYPENEHRFRDLIDSIYLNTKGFDGPYILSDKRYKDSRVVHYRYGGIRPNYFSDVTGAQIPVLISPDGKRLPDKRLPHFVVPDWTTDPFGESAPPSQEPTLKSGRYLVESALTYSNAGGIYLAKDRETGNKVLIKEARPFINIGIGPTSQDAVTVRKKEYRILTKIAHTGVAPEPIDFFQDWEHYFLVEEYIDGIPLGSYSAMTNVALLSRPTIKDSEKFYIEFKTIFKRAATIIETLHEHDIVFGDLSPNNLLIRPTVSDLRIIDFESAYEIGEDSSVRLFTPGFALAEQIFERPPRFEDDYYSLGAVMLCFLFPINSILSLNPDARYTFLRSIIRDTGSPRAVERVVTRLMADEPAERPKPNEVIELLESTAGAFQPNIESHADEILAAGDQLLKQIIGYIESVAQYERKDRLFPADSKVFATNPLSLAYGACGVSHAINTVKGSIAPRVVDWILSQEITTQLYAPGLYVGLSGVAWVLLDLGLREKSEEILTSTYEHPLLRETPDMFYGMSGWGMANLKFFLETGDERYLEKAREAGTFLSRTCSVDENGNYFWKSFENVYLGLAHGSSGVGLFLMYLYLVTKSEEFLEIGRRALDFDISHSVRNREGGLSWTHRLGVSSPALPYWKYGSAGIGIIALRYYRISGEQRYKAILDDIFLDTDRKYTVFPGKFNGLAGIGDFLIDMYQFTGQREYLESAYKLASGIMLFKIDREQGAAFPGDDLLRISCDYGTGGAGISIFLHRLLQNGGSDFMFDDVFENAECVKGDTRNVEILAGHRASLEV